MRSLLAQVDLGEAYRLNPDGGTSVAEQFPNPASLINSLLPNVFVIAGLLLFVFIFVAGFKMATSPDKKKNFEDGRKKLGYAIGGFILLFMSYWIVQIIQVVTGISILGGN